MKENEAPEKIYLDEDDSWHLTNTNGDSVEYTRTDAFIEKAVIWISNNCYIPHSTLESFKNYMKEIEL